MIGQFVGSLASYFTKHKVFFWILLSIVVGILGFGVMRLEIDNDFYSVFPKGERFSRFSKIIKENNFQQQLIFSLQASEDEDENVERLASISEQLNDQFGREIGNIQIYRDIDERALMNYLQNVAITQLNDHDYVQIEQKITSESIDKQLAQIKERLSGPQSFLLNDYFAKDPIGLLSSAMNTFNVQSDSSLYTVESGIVYSADKQRVFFFADMMISTSDGKKLAIFDDKLHHFIDQQPDSLHLDVFGVYQVSLANIQQIQKDTFIASGICLALILTLLIGYYRSLTVPLFFLLPALFGALSGLGLAGFFHPQINAISIATASVLLGIALDYSFHFYTHYKHSGNLLQTVRQIASPMLLGNFTTLVAFAALLYTQSVILQNFGLVALFTLLGAALFTLLAMPAILTTMNVRLKVRERTYAKFKMPKTIFRIALIGIIAFTAFCLVKIQNVQFDADIQHLSYHPQHLQDKEKTHTGVHPQTEKRLSIFASAPSQQQARQIAERLYIRLGELKEQHKISEIVSPSPYLLSDQHWNEKQQQWLDFWQRHPHIRDTVHYYGQLHGFSSSAFDPFFQSIENPKHIAQEGEHFVEQLGMRQLVHSSTTQHSIITSIVVSRSTMAQLKADLATLPGVFVFDTADIASEMLTIVQDDFNFLLYFSSSLVFLSLLIVYGRIELALLTFLPMMLAWIWILGISSIFHITFNFVNIIITTFIFGLGDDFSIFITDGLIQKYRFNKNSLTPYKSAIVLSGITTIIGTGVLIFAQHPSIHSIALVSVVGIGTILCVALYVQPELFHWLVIRRVKKKRSPATFFSSIHSIITFCFFFLACLLLTMLFLVFILPLPTTRKKKELLLSFLMSFLAKITCIIGGKIRKKDERIGKQNSKNPSIVVSNHSSSADILVLLSLFPRSKMMVKRWVYNFPFFSILIRYLGYIEAEKGIDANLPRIQQLFEDGYSLIIFPEGSRSEDGEIHRFHKGAFALSQQLDVPILPVLLVGMSEYNSKNDFILHYGTIHAVLLDKVEVYSHESDRDYTQRIQRYMRSSFVQYRQSLLTFNHWKSSIIRNYVLKSPVLEWYVRIKLMLEGNNFQHYDQLLHNSTFIYDVGCGYGYLSYYLHYRNTNRTIVGIDYDEEKIMTADNAIKKNNNLVFRSENVKNTVFQPCDAVLFNDVLHYMNKEEQYKTMQHALDALHSHGILIIRDGITDMENIPLKQARRMVKNSRRIEWMSTKFFRFNEAKTPLEFLRIADIRTFAHQNNLSLEIISHSKTTSNMLFVLKKNLSRQMNTSNEACKSRE